MGNFASNDYLGLSQHPRVIEAWQLGLQQWGAGASASRLVTGTQSPHLALERAISEWKKTEAALSFANGYATSVGVLSALLQKGDVVIMDKLCHASLIDGARLSGATMRIFPHNDVAKLEKILKKVAGERVLVVTESVFSMDGDVAPLAEIVKLKEKYGTLLMVDEAHGLGVYGEHGLGLTEALGLEDKVDFQMGTLGKSAGVAGGYVAAERMWIELIQNKARSFIYSTAPPAAQCMAALEGMRIIVSPEGKELRETMWNNARHFDPQASSAIVPLIVGDTDVALGLAERLRERGYHVPAIRYPTVPRQTARLRFTFSALHTLEQIDGLRVALAECRGE